MPRTILLSRCLGLLFLSVPLWAQTPLGELFAGDPTTPVAVQSAGTGMTVTAGSQLSAGIAPATLKFYSGGQVRICPRSKLSVNSDARGLMLGMDAGSVEIDFHLDANTTDIVFTPDLSIRLAGSGVYHFALGVTGQGDTCFKPLAGNAAGIVVSEVMGSEEFGIAADQPAFFPGGKLSARTRLPSNCGCAAPPVPLPGLRAEATPVAPPSNAAGTQAKPLIPATGPSETNAASETKQPPHPTVETPFVFSASAPPAPARVEFSALPNVFLAQTDLDPPVLQKKEAAPVIPPDKPTSSASAADNTGKKQNKGFLGKIKGFFTGIFHR